MGLTGKEFGMKKIVVSDNNKKNKKSNAWPKKPGEKKPKIRMRKRELKSKKKNRKGGKRS